MPLQPIQVVFQGGGAKLCCLLAAAAAIQELERKDLIEVRGVAGTSAGAIVAALYAAGRDMDLIRERIRGKGEHYHSMIIPNRNSIGIAYRLATGRPLYNEAGLRKMVGDLLNKDGSVPRTFTDLQTAAGRVIFLAITAADIRSGAKKVYRHSSDNLIDAIADSCALPFLFRGGFDRQFRGRWRHLRESAC